MRMPMILLLLALGGLAAAPLEHPIERLRWMGGCWERASRSGVVEEQWTAPRGGSMLGLSRTIRGDSTVAWEAIRIYARADRLVYAATPSGQAPAEFESTVVSDTLVVFENPEHDFPQRILYRPAVGDSLHARIEGMRGTELRGADFRYGRARCAGPAG